MKSTIEIRDNKSVLSITLTDILSCIDSIEEYRWKLLWLTATSHLKKFSVLSLEEEINKSESGYEISATDLIKFNEKFSQIIEIMLIGDKDSSKLKRYKDDVEMKNNCAFCIELVDSSYWEVTSTDNKAIQSMLAKFEFAKYNSNN